MNRNGRSFVYQYHSILWTPSKLYGKNHILISKLSHSSIIKSFFWWSLVWHSMCAPQYHWDRRIDLNCKGICYTVERAMYLSTSVKYAQMDLSRPKWLLIVSFTLLPRSNLFKLINSKRVGKNSKYCYLQYILANIIF